MSRFNIRFELRKIRIPRARREEMCKYRGNRKARVYVLGRALIKVLQPFARRYHDASISGRKREE